MAEFNVLGKIILGAVLVILGAVIIGVIADMTNEKTTQSPIDNELVTITGARLVNADINGTYPFTIANAPTGWRASNSDCNINKYALTNGTFTYTVTTDYTLSTAGVLYLVNSTNMRKNPTNLTYVSYRYCGNEYVNSSWARSVLNMTGGFIAIMLLAAAVGIFYSVYQQTKE